MDKRILKLDGWMDEDELDFIHNYAGIIPQGCVLIEIGAWLGRSTMALATASKDKILITIDNWKGQEEYIDTTMSLAKTGRVFDMFKDNCRLFGIEPIEFTSLDNCKVGNLYYISMNSVDASKLFPDSCIDFWFVDGNHNLLEDDYIAWEHTFKENIPLLGHDFTPVYPKVISAVRKYIKTYKQCNTIWYKV